MDKKTRSSIALIFPLFLVLTAVLTYPLIFKITTHIPGFFSTDEPYAFLWDNWRIKYCLMHAMPLRTTNLIAYPFGMDLYSVGLFPYLWIAITHFLSITTTPVLAYNIQIILNFLLTGIFTYLLVFYLTGNRLSAIFSGIIFAFCPYQFVRAWQHLGLTYNQWISLCLLSAIAMKEKQSRKNAFLVLISMFLLFSFDYTIMYIGTMVIAFFLMYTIFYNWKIKIFRERHILLGDLKYIKKVSFIGIAVFIILLPQFFNYIKNLFVLYPIHHFSAHNPYHRAFEDLFTQSAKPLSYFLPAAVHPVFGNFTKSFVGTPLYGQSFTEHTLYLGWVPLALAFISFRVWRKRRSDPMFKTEAFRIGFFLFLVVAAWLFSQPPWWRIGPVRIFMPSFFMYKVLPMFRAYCRFGAVVMLGVAALAGFGLKFVLAGFKTIRSKVAVAALFYGLLLFEFWNYPPFKVIDVSRPPSVYRWLKEQPQSVIIAEYPLDADSPNQLYKFYQITHEKKIINGALIGTYANAVAKTITKLSDPHTAGVLKWMGVKYALVHRDSYLDTSLIKDKEELSEISRNPSLKFIKDFENIDVYEVAALPEKADVPYEK